MGGGDLPRLLTDLRAGRLTGGDSVTNFVLLLQEVYRADADVPRGAATRPRRIAQSPEHSRRSDIVDVARAQGLHLFYVPSMSNGWTDGDALAEDRGNAILSTLPLSDYAAIELPFEGQRRVALVPKASANRCHVCATAYTSGTKSSSHMTRRGRFCCGNNQPTGHRSRTVTMTRAHDSRRVGRNSGTCAMPPPGAAYARGDNPSTRLVRYAFHAGTKPISMPLIITMARYEYSVSPSARSAR